jgi:hypothetical protein
VHYFDGVFVSCHLRNALSHLGFTSWAQVTNSELWRDEWLEIPQFGPVTLAELEAVLAAKGEHLRPYDPPGAPPWWEDDPGRSRP